MMPKKQIYNQREEKKKSIQTSYRIHLNVKKSFLLHFCNI